MKSIRSPKDNNVIKVHTESVELDDPFLVKEDSEFLRNAFASSHINFLLGAGFCCGLLPTLACREEWIAQACANGERKHEALLQYEFFRNVVCPMEGLHPNEEMVEFAKQLKRLLAARGTISIPRKASLFTTNYDAILEDAFEIAGVSYNDGFEGRISPIFATRSFGHVQYVQSLSLEYSAQVPTINIIKLHGSVTWSKENPQAITYCEAAKLIPRLIETHGSLLSQEELDKIKTAVSEPFIDSDIEVLNGIVDSKSPEWSDEAESFLEDYYSTLQIVNPNKSKFEETVMGLTYYELMRLFANELDRNNALLVSFGFSFADEHILEIVKRALENPQLILLVCCHTPDDLEWYQNKLNDYDNVKYVVPTEQFNLADLCALLKEVR